MEPGWSQLWAAGRCARGSPCWGPAHGLLQTPGGSLPASPPAAGPLACYGHRGGCCPPHSSCPRQMRCPGPLRAPCNQEIRLGPCAGRRRAGGSTSEEQESLPPRLRDPFPRKGRAAQPLPVRVQLLADKRTPTQAATGRTMKRAEDSPLCLPSPPRSAPCWQELGLHSWHSFLPSVPVPLPPSCSLPRPLLQPSLVPEDKGRTDPARRAAPATPGQRVSAGSEFTDATCGLGRTGSTQKQIRCVKTDPAQTRPLRAAVQPCACRRRFPGLKPGLLAQLRLPCLAAAGRDRSLKPTFVINTVHRDRTPLLEMELWNCFVSITSLIMTNAWVIILCFFCVAPGTNNIISIVRKGEKAGVREAAGSQPCAAKCLRA